MSPQEEVGHREVIWLLGSLSGLYRLPFDAALVSQEFPPPYSIATFHEAARSLGLKTGSVGIEQIDWQKLPLPAIAFLRPVQVDAADREEIATAADPFVVSLSNHERREDSKTSAVPEHAPPRTPILILKSDGQKLLYFRAGSQTPEILPVAEAPQWLEPELILVAKEASTEPAAGEPEEIAGFTAEKKEFGFQWFIPELLKHKSIWRDILIASLAINLVGLVTPLITQVVIDKVIVHQTHSTLIVLGIALVMFMLFTSGMTWLRQYLVLHTGNRIDAVLGSQVFKHLLRLPLPYFEQRPTGTLVARLHGVETIREFVSGAAVTLILDLPFLLIFLAVMFAYSWQLSLIAVGLLGLVGFISFLVAPVFRDKLNRQFMLGARNQAFLTEYVSGMATVKSLQMEPDIDRKYGDLLAQYLAAGFSTKQVGNTYNVIANGLEQVMTLAILIVGALLVMQNDGFTVGMLVAFQMFAGRMSQPMLRLVGLWQEFQQANIAVKRLGDILDMPQEPHALVPSREMQNNQGQLDLVNLAFRYSEHHPWLYRNLNMRFKPGHLTVLMGPSGCGKSTLAKLLLGFYQPSDGLIELDGRDIRHLAANELRATFGVVPQETVLFAGTIYDNLVMAHPHASFEDVIEACKAAEIHEVLDKLPEGYQTEIGERGTGLSGGQRQRLAIARALLKKPKILIFDEAVSNLDQQTAEHFARTINKLKGKVTMLFITHQIPRGLAVDEVFSFGSDQQTTKIGVVMDDCKQ
ncbi:MAG: peptidase domain-containing ABC transporter [Betaproteobacteria bacterium]|nr:peptidase domain-containing ABC transporter [Betaproteobacteria bacterium]